MKKVKSVICLLLVITMALGLLACGNQSSTDDGDSTPAESTAGVSLTGGSTATPPATNLKCATLSPEGSEFIYDSITIGTSYWGRFIAGLSPGESDAAMSLVFDVVFETDPNTKEVYSDILEDWYFEDDTTLIMKLKDNIYFSNGEKATSEDLLFSYYNYIERGSSYLNAYTIDFDNSKCIDELTLSMKFEKFYVAFFNGYTIYLYDKSWAESVGWDSMEWYAPVGSGPYTCTEYVQDDHMTFVARDDYWNKGNDPVVIKQWIIKYYADQSTLKMALETGDVAFCRETEADYTSYIEKGGAESADGYVMETYSSGTVHVLNFSYIDTEVFKDKLVREAFAYGINWAELGEIVFGALYKPVDAFVPENSPEYVSLGYYEYDLDKAKALLSEAGYDASNPLKLETTLFNTPYYKNVGEAFQFYANQMGVEVSLDFADISAALIVWLDSAGTDFCFLYNNLGSVGAQLCRNLEQAAEPFGCSFAYINDPVFLELYEEHAYSSDTERSIAKSKEAQQYLHDETLCIPYAECVFIIGYNPSVFESAQIPYGALNADYYNLANLSYASIWN